MKLRRILTIGAIITMAACSPKDCDLHYTNHMQSHLEKSSYNRVYFEYDSPKPGKMYLDPVQDEAVRSQAEWLRRNPRINVALESFCDEKGNKDYNMALAKRRAEVVMHGLQRAYRDLSGEELAPGRVEIKIFGSGTHPYRGADYYQNGTSASKNRVVVMRVKRQQYYWNYRCDKSATK